MLNSKIISLELIPRHSSLAKPQVFHAITGLKDQIYTVQSDRNLQISSLV